MNAMLDYRNPPPLFDVGTLWATIRRRWPIVVGVTALVVLGATGYLLVTKSSYTASASILVDPRDVKTTNIDSVLPGIGADSAAIASQVSVIGSRDLLGRVFADLHLEADPEYAPSSGGGLFGAFKSAAAPSSETVFQHFQSAVLVEREGLTYVIDVTVKSHDAEKAARIANAVVDQYIATQASQNTTANTDVTSALNARIAVLQTDVSKAEQAVEAFKTQNGIFDATTGGTLQSQADTLSAQVLAAQDALNQAQVKVDQANAAGTSPAALLQLSDIWSSPTMDALRLDYNQRAATLASDQATMGPKHPTIVRAQAEVTKVQGLLAREANRIVKQLKSDRTLAAGNLDKLQASLADLRKRSGQSDVAAVGLRQLQRQADAARAVLTDFMQRSQETSQLPGLQNSQVHVISSAAPPPDPTWPKPMLILPVSALLGLLLGCGVALLLGERAAAPAPLPASPDRPRKSKQQPAHAPVEAFRPGLSSARRLAGLDSVRRDLNTGTDSPLSRALQDVLHEVLAELPRLHKPFIIACAGLGDPALAGFGAELLALGLEHIGGRALIAGTRSDRPNQAGDFDFILALDGQSDLAAHPDLTVLVLGAAEAEAWDRANTPGTISFVVDLDTQPVARPRIVANADQSLARAAG